MRYIDQEKIYDSTERGLTIFQHFFPGVDLRANKHFKARGDEKTASAKLTFYEGLWRITDFGNQSELKGTPAIQFVAAREGLSYYDALLFIEEVILNKRIEGSGFTRTVLMADYSYRDKGSDDVNGKYTWFFKDAPSESDLSHIGRYVTADILERFSCKTIDKYEYCTFSKKLNKDVVHIFKATKDYPMFLFDYGDFQKLYKPNEQNKKYRFLYIGNKPANYVYGLSVVEESDNEFVDEESGEVDLPENKENALVIDLFRCSGESDALNLASLGFHVYWLNSESAVLSYADYKKVDGLCQNHYQIMDLDATGKQEALRNALSFIDLYSIELPNWLGNKADWRGNPCKDLKDFINLAGENQEQTHFEFLVLKRSARRVRFWDKKIDKKTKNINYSINMEFFFFFLKANGFYQVEYSYHKKAGYAYVKLSGKVVELINPDDIKRIIKRFTKNWIKSRKLLDSIAILNKINTSAQLTESNIDGIDMIKLNFKNYDRFTEYLNFRKGSIRISKDEIKHVPHSMLPNYILGELTVSGKRLSHLIERDVRVMPTPAIEVQPTSAHTKILTELENCTSEADSERLHAELAALPDIEKYLVTINDDDFIFTNFLRDLARIHWRKELYDKKPLSTEEVKEQNLALANLMFVLGYHCAQYKNPGKPWITLLQDNLISEIGKASGGSGKSLFSAAITHVRTSFYKGGRVLNSDKHYQFFYDGFTEFHDFIEIDDFHEYGDFGFFYTQVTGKREINPKNYSPITLDYEDSGKLLLSTNYELQNVDNSTTRRLLNCSVSDYYHEKSKSNDYRETRTPLTKFNRMLYDDFTDEDWVKFYNFIAYCIQLQMRFYKIQPPTMNLEKRQLRRIMSQGLGRDEEFFRWANDYFIVAPPDFHEAISPAENGYFNSFVVRNNAFNNFKETLTRKQQNEYKSGKFKKHLQAWCEYHDILLNPEEVPGVDSSGRILRSINGETLECFYLRYASETPVAPPAADNAMPF
jgi:hypothetical protein